MASSVTTLLRRLSLVIGVLFVGTTPSLGQSPSLIEELNESSFLSQVLGTSRVWLVEFVQNDCQRCLDFAPEINSVAIALKGILKVGVVNCHNTPKLCGQEKIETLPGLKAYGWEVKRNPYTNKVYKDEGVLYKGALRFKDVSKFATALLPDKFVQNVSSGDSFDSFLSTSPELPRVILISAKQSVPPMFKGISLRFRDTVVFGQVSSSDDDLVDKFKATSFPAVFLLEPGKDFRPIKYEGQIAPEEIAAFVREYASEARLDTPDPTQQDKGDDSRGRKGSGGWIQTLTPAKFKKDVLQNDAIFLVALLDSTAQEGCDEKIGAWHAIGQQLTGVVFSGEVNVSTPEQQSELETVYKPPLKWGQRCVSLLLFPFGDDKEDSDPVVILEDFDVKSLTQAVYDIAPSTFVMHLDESTFDTFAHSDIKTPKFILMSSKTEVPGMFRTIATNFHQGNQFGFVHESQTEIISHFHVKKFPSVAALFPRPDPKDKTQMQLGIMPYQGPLKFNGLVEFVIQVSGSVRNMFGYTLEIPQVEDDDQFALHCIEPKRLCVVGLFNSDGALDAFKQVAAKWEGGGQFSFLWIDVSKSSPSAGIARQLEVGSSSLPTAAVISPTKNRITVLPDAFSVESLNSFLDGLLLGRVHTFELKEMPNFAAASKMASDDPGSSDDQSSSTASADVSNDTEPPVDEEFDLADILSEHVEDETSLTKEQKLQEVDKELEEEERKKAEEGKKKKKKKKNKKKKTKSADKDEL